MPQEETLSRFILLPELLLERVHAPSRAGGTYECRKESAAEVCPRCATLAKAVYDRRCIRVKDAPIRGKGIWLRIKKRRFWCATCKRPFTEPVQGIWPRRRTTQRYRRAVLWGCEHFVDLKSVKQEYRCSYALVYEILNEQLDLQIRMRQDPWPQTIGIDEHGFHKRRGAIPFVSVIVDYNRRRLLEVVAGRSAAALEQGLQHVERRENVENVIVDLSDPYKTFAKEFFPNARIIADKFHVLRLLHPHINRYRKEITGDRRSLLVRKLLLMNSQKLDYFVRRNIELWLENYPALKELYTWKEALHRFYRIRGYNKARKALIQMLDAMSTSTVKEIQTLRRTLQRWFHEVLNYFLTRLTNGRTEGFNNKAKVIKRRAYGYKNFENYRKRLLCACY